ncbi:MAG TPA: chromate transporter [Methylovirgula sp.]
MAPPTEEIPSRRQLFLTFLKIGVCGFGGVASWAHRIIVEERRWLSDQDYAELLGIASLLPGANTVNIAVMLGDRYRGITGSVSGVGGLLLMPLLILIGIAILYEKYALQGDVRNAVACAAAATAGLVLATGVKMIRNLRPDILGAASCILVFVAVGLFQLSLTATLIVVALAALAIRMTREREEKGEQAS